MKTIYYMLLSLVLISSSCKRTDLIGGDEIVEGENARVSVNVDWGAITRSGLSQSQEQTINNIYVMVFDKMGTLVSKSFFSSNITSNLQNIATRSGSNMSIYVVANLSPENTHFPSPGNYLYNVHTVAQLNQVMIYDLADDLNVNRDLVMYGSLTGLTISSASVQNVTIQLYYAVAKVTLYVVKALTNAGDSYNIPNWTVKNYPHKSYLFAQPTDGVNPTVDADFEDSPTSIAWVDTTIMISGVSTPAKYAFLYMYENRRGTNSNTLETQKATNVPAKSTAIVLEGYYKANGATSVQGVTTTVYLGENNKNDYNVKRGKEYSYIVTVKSINNINVDSRVVGNMYGYQVNVYNTTLDCHPDRRPVQINSWPGTATVQVVNSDGTTPTWLHLSTIDLNKAVSNARVTYNPAIDMVSSLTLTYPTTTPEVLASQMIYLYADENLTTTARSSTIKVTSTATLTQSQTVTINVTQKGYQTMGNVGFRALNNNGTVNTADDYILAVENTEEVALNLTPGAVAGTEAVTSMQWGYNLTITEPTASGSNDYYYRNGYTNTLLLVYGNTTGALGSTLKPPFGRLSAANASTASVTITENAMDPIFNTYPARYCFEKNRDLDGDGAITNNNSNGVNEINWYLPSAEELYAMYVGQYALTTSLTGANYHVSSEVYGSNNNTNSMSYGTGIGGAVGKSQAVSVRCVRRIYQTQPQATKNSPYVEAGTRIINNSGYKSSILRTTPVSRPVPMNSQNSTINNQLSPRFEVAKTDCRLNGTTGASTMVWSAANGWTSASDNSSAAGVIASPATGCQAYSDANAAAGSWRLPTQREMYIIMFMRRELLAGQDGYVAPAAGSYWTSSNLGATLGWYGVRGNSTLAFGGKTTTQSVRCIRDL